MKKSRWIFYAIYAVFHIILVIFTFYVDSKRNDFGALLGLLSWLTLAKVGAVIGLILLIIDIVWSRMTNASAEKENGVLQQELQTLKAKLFDMQEASRKPVQPSQPNPKG
jgi:hypothetical protein